MIIQISVSVVVWVLRNRSELGSHFWDLHHGFDNEDLYDGGDDGVDDADDPIRQESENLSRPDTRHGVHPESEDISWKHKINHSWTTRLVSLSYWEIWEKDLSGVGVHADNWLVRDEWGSSDLAWWQEVVIREKGLSMLTIGIQ